MASEGKHAEIKAEGKEDGLSTVSSSSSPSMSPAGSKRASPSGKEDGDIRGAATVVGRLESLCLCNVRAEPSLSGKILGTIGRGHVFRVLDTEGGRGADDHVGLWVRHAALGPDAHGWSLANDGRERLLGEAPVFCEDGPRPRFLVVYRCVNVRRGPSAKDKVVGQVMEGEVRYARQVRNNDGTAHGQWIEHDDGMGGKCGWSKVADGRTLLLKRLGQKGVDGF